MRVASTQTFSYEAARVRREVDGLMGDILEKGKSRVDSFNYDGYGTGFNYENKSGNWNLSVVPGGKEPQAFDYHYDYKDSQIFGFNGPYRAVKDLSYRLEADGSKVYQHRVWSKGDGLVSDTLARVEVGVDGKETYQTTDHSPKFSNWLRQNPSTNKLAAMSIGGLAGGALGYFLGGTSGAACTAPIGAALVGQLAKDFEFDNREAPRADRERSLYRPVTVVQNCMNGAAALGALGIAARFL